MKCVIATTFNDTYLWNLPLVTWCWNKLGIGVICFMPYKKTTKVHFVLETVHANCKEDNRAIGFVAHEHKEATYAQCARLYASSLDLPKDEVLITGDVDMAVFGDYLKQKVASFDIFGYDLTPDTQYPICYISASVKDWRNAMDINGKTYQQCLDETVGKIECDHFRGNQWSLDQGTVFNKVSQVSDKYLHGRARPGTQFAGNRVDRDDINWRAYVNENLVDAHLWRPGYTDANFANILELMQMKYPKEDFTWLINYNNRYKELL